MLDLFYNSISEVLMTDAEILIKLKKLRDLVKLNIIDNNFRLSCVERVIDTMDCWVSQGKDWNSPPIFYHEELKYSVRIIFWPAFNDNNPHEHKTWSVTGILHNELDINIYEMLESPKRLKKLRTISANVGEVGYLVPGCIHNVCNSSHDLSASLHIFNNISSIDKPEENAIWYPSPRKHNLIKGATDRALLSCLSIASSIRNKKSLNIIDRIYSHLPLPLKLNAISSMYLFDPSYARKCFDELEGRLKNLSSLDHI